MTSHRCRRCSARSRNARNRTLAPGHRQAPCVCHRDVPAPRQALRRTPGVRPQARRPSGGAAGAPRSRRGSSSRRASKAKRAACACRHPAARTSAKWVPVPPSPACAAQTPRGVAHQHVRPPRRDKTKRALLSGARLDSKVRRFGKRDARCGAQRARHVQQPQQAGPDLDSSAICAAFHTKRRGDGPRTLSAQTARSVRVNPQGQSGGITAPTHLSNASSC